MSLSFQNRIAVHYMIATAIITAIPFTAVYLVVFKTVHKNLDNDLSFEANKHTKELKLVGDSIQFLHSDEWQEKEHYEIQVNPVFINSWIKMEALWISLLI